MEHIPSSKNSLSSDSSVESIAESTLKTPLDTQPALPLIPSKMTTKMLTSRLELVPKRSATAPDSLYTRSSNSHSKFSNPHSQFTSNNDSEGPRLETRGGHRMRRPTDGSMASMTSHSSSRSLLRRTLLLVTSSTPSSRPYSTLGTPSLLTPRSSVSSLASTSLSSIGLSHRGTQSGRPASPSSLSSSRKDRSARNNSNEDVLTSSPVTSSSLAADPTTALSPTNSNSLAQFSTVPAATSALLQFGVPMRAQSQGSLGAAVDGAAKHAGRIEARRRRSRDAVRRSSECEYDDARSGSATGFGTSRSKTGTASSSWWGAKATAAPNLPSISRVLEPDGLGSMDLGDALHGHITPVASTSALGLNIPVTWREEARSGQDIAATPRPAFPIESQAQQRSWLWHDKDERASGVDVMENRKGKGKATIPIAPHLQAFVPSLQRSSSAPAPGPALAKSRSSSTPIPNLRATAAAAAGVRVAATHTSIHARLSPAAPMAEREKKYDSNLPSLAAIESGSRLMRAKIVCATCNEVGPDFPRCGRCGEAWCSRECRVEANRESGGRHRCSPSVA